MFGLKCDLGGEIINGYYLNKRCC